MKGIFLILFYLYKLEEDVMTNSAFQSQADSELDAL